MKHPKRGEIWLVDFNPARGSEQSGQRPAVVIQNDVTFDAAKFQYQQGPTGTGTCNGAQVCASTA